MFASKLYKSVYDSENLNVAWNKVRSNKGVCGVDGMNIVRFNKMMFNNLLNLKEYLREGAYHPSPVKRFSIKKPDGGKRPLGILTVEDRIVQRAVMQVIEPLFDRRFSACSFGYRKGISIQHAMEQMTRHYNCGFDWVLDADIADYFQNIDHKILTRQIKRVLPDRRILQLLQEWLNLGHNGFGQKRLMGKKSPKIGILQGSPLSPLLANIYLDPFDKAISRKGFNLLRYADDFVILCKTGKEAETAMKYVRRELNRLKLNLNTKKTQITHFNKGVYFLGRLLKTQKGSDGNFLKIRSLKRKVKEEEKQYGSAIH